MPRFRAIACAALWVPAVFAQLTPAQKEIEFTHLVSIFAKNYGPDAWKRDAFGFDIYDARPWMERVRRTETDLEFLDLCAEWVSSLRDAHSSFSMLSDFLISTGITADIYDGMVLIETVSRTTLPQAQYPFETGDEVVSLDGRPVSEWLDHFARVVSEGNERARRREAAALLFRRPQLAYPRAPEAGERLSLTVRRAAGETQTFEIPWVKSGTPVTRIGPVTLFGKRGSAASAVRESDSLLDALDLRLGRERVVGIGARLPSYDPPQGFTLRLGRAAADFHWSGVYEAQGKRIGLLRIPRFTPPSQAAALAELNAEIRFLQENTDGLVVDITRNPGGGCYGAEALRRLMPNPFRLHGEEVRVTLARTIQAEAQLSAARAQGAPAATVQRLEGIVRQFREGLAREGARTEAVPICNFTDEFTPAADVYSKPILLLVDEFTTSWGDSFAAAFQDNERGAIFGARTNGAGGAVVSTDAGFFSEGSVSYSIGMGVRPQPRPSDFGDTPYLENAGVRADVQYDFMTRDNLMQRGRPFVEAFTAEILKRIEGGK